MGAQVNKLVGDEETPQLSRTFPGPDTSSAAWGPAADGLRCRLHKIEELQTLAVSIRNESNRPIDLPTWNDGVPKLTITILEEPEVMSLPGFGGAMPSSRMIQPGEVYTYPFSKDYLVFYGTPKDEGWIRFEPTDQLYHLKVTVQTKAGELTSTVLETKLKWAVPEPAAAPDG